MSFAETQNQKMQKNIIFWFLICLLPWTVTTTEAGLYGFTIAEDTITHHDPHNYLTQGATEPHPTGSPRKETAARKVSSSLRFQVAKLVIKFCICFL